MAKHYTDEKNAQVVLSLLKEHGIKKIVASPGTTNLAITASIQHDPYFEVYSSVDERSAAYMACGLAAESNEPVVLSCTGATASRNYLPALTEAYYRKLPILAITSTQAISKVGHHIAQIIDRGTLPDDTTKLSQTLPIIKDNEDLWDCEVKVNKAILELKRHGGGPVHLNLQTTYNLSYETIELPKFRVIKRITPKDDFPLLPKGRIGIFIGSHKLMSKELTSSIEKFCSVNNAVVFCDHTSNYYGKFRVQFALTTGQIMLDKKPLQPDVLIHMGEITGDYYSLGITGKEVWRVNEDGEIRDTYRKLKYVFEMNEDLFFNHYSSQNIQEQNSSYYEHCSKMQKEYSNQIPELPFSNVWIASKIANQIPEGSTIHFAILNSLRSWNFFELPKTVTSSSNVGGFGIDGCVSSLIGASLSNPNKLYFGIIGDLAFFYDLNSIGNRHVGKNLRIMLINNGKGTEFRQYNHAAAQHGEDADQFIAAAGHYGNKSRTLVKHYAQELGFEYISADNKKDFEQVYKRFLHPKITEKPMLFEVFTNSEEESDALKIILNLNSNFKGNVKHYTKLILGTKGINSLKKAMRK